MPRRVAASESFLARQHHLVSRIDRGGGGHDKDGWGKITRGNRKGEDDVGQRKTFARGCKACGEDTKEGCFVMITRVCCIAVHHSPPLYVSGVMRGCVMRVS